ncbi:hypothetical protein KIN20_028375 [Parelaphostrongylus tenuis]|uniref:Uncharacterized protein n=1 Tax=Parelaphostrongylus tenuis TaxID=148309 RepID=A0AAD5WER4_PARTN|nr:hypothetical protein KIN20_028375 [Parelaphostrongylus tenuis]
MKNRRTLSSSRLSNRPNGVKISTVPLTDLLEWRFLKADYRIMVGKLGRNQ